MGPGPYRFDFDQLVGLVLKTDAERLKYLHDRDHLVQELRAQIGCVADLFPCTYRCSALETLVARQQEQVSNDRAAFEDVIAQRTAQFAMVRVRQLTSFRPF